MFSEQLIDRIEKIYEANLIEDARRLCNLWLSRNETGDLNIARVLSIQADCFFQSEEYASAIEGYGRAVHIRRLLKITNKSAIPIKLDDATIAYKLYQCHMALNNIVDARKILESVAAKNRSPKISVALGKLYEQAGQERTAQMYYKEVMREFPLALDTLVKLASLGAKISDYVPHVLENFPLSNNVDWLSLYLKAENLKYTGYYLNAVDIFRQMGLDASFRNNVDIAISLAESEYFSGNNEAALTQYNFITSVHSKHVRGLEVYSSLLYFCNKMEDLSNLMLRLNEICPESMESVISVGFYTLALGKFSRSLVFAQKILSTNEWNIEASLLKAFSFYNGKRRKQASLEFSRVYQRAPFRYEVVRGLMDCLMAITDNKSALMLAQNVKKNISSNPKFAIIYATTISTDSTCMDKARVFLEGVNKNYPDCLEIVYALIDIYKRSGLLIRAQEMIQGTLVKYSTSTLHYKYGLILLKLKNYRDAMEHLNLSLLLDPNNKEARKAVMAVDVGNFTNIFSDIDALPDLQELASDSDIENVLP